MNNRSSLSREPSVTRSYRSQRSSIAPNENIFSDDHALNSPVTIGDSPLSDFPASRQQDFDNPPIPQQTHDAVSHTSTFQADRGSVTKRRLMIDDVPSSSAGGLRRTLSTSSRLTIPRSASPYNGPTAPSHPYAMYSQMTRASSVASASTMRPGSETAFFPTRGPEHPYQMYPQNTMPVDGEDITTNGIPLGFPRSVAFQPSSGGSSSDVGDIIGTDGHIEQLPPYTRYADNTVAKGNMDTINGPRLSRIPTQSAETVRTPAPPSETASTTLLRPTEQFEQETESQRARKEGWKEKAQRKTIVGMPLWGLLVIVIIVILSATIGGVVGGVIGNKQGAERAYANGAVTTIWLDAIPTTLDPHSSPLPMGHFQIPLNQSEEIKDCIPDPDHHAAWGCMDIAYIGVRVFENNNGVPVAAFEDFSVNTQDFRYGPQPPDFNGTEFPLEPMKDKDAGELGVAMFFSVLFDKLSIIPEDALETIPEKRSVDGDVLKRSVAQYDGMPLQPSQRPWFCFWNSTINEFFIYLNQGAPSEPSATAKKSQPSPTDTSPTGTITTFTSSSSGTTPTAILQELTMTTSSSVVATTFPAHNPTYKGTPTTGTTIPNKRSYGTSAPDISNYPKLIKMVEKRKPEDPNTLHIDPYCQKMQVLDDWSIVPIEDVETICIEEKQYAQETSSADQRKRLLRKDDERDVVSDLGSYCICEWTSY